MISLIGSKLDMLHTEPSLCCTPLRRRPCVVMSVPPCITSSAVCRVQAQVIRKWLAVSPRQSLPALALTNIVNPPQLIPFHPSGKQIAIHTAVQL